MFFINPPGVYAPQEDTGMLAAALRRESLRPGAEVLDVGAGSGALAVAAARHGAGRVTATDAAFAAVLTTLLNAWFAGHGNRVRAHRGDLLHPVAGRHFDLVMANPPYVPSAAPVLPRRGRARAWDAGPDGRAVLDRLCAQVPALLAPYGVLLLVHSQICDPARTVGLLAEAGLETSVTDRRFIPFGPVMRGRAAWLEAQGLIVPGQDKEELVVVRAQRAA
ncbi:HemK2/MTQ2 family protein methyltransferase [Streptomyces sp. CB02923]|uniref:HemK2/MTQ2 family protein methyltransferase n=1 Tax=Streptomyces sp. CB02923 TaxID=1718985 RepID=UPI0009A11ED3|nr:HemK2/MTQ2 family protein methyltransferase [Streptomyces sp. CB02923]